jgi:hypothetical protein
MRWQHGGNLGTSGSVAFQFHRVGEIVIDTSKPGSEDQVLEAALDAGADDDVQTEGSQTTVLSGGQRRSGEEGADVSRIRAGARRRGHAGPENRVPVSGRKSPKRCTI